MTSVGSATGHSTVGAGPILDLSPTELSSVLGLRAPTEEQAQVIAAPLTAGLVQAGAGSGKTETMAARVVWLVSTGRVDPDRVLGLTFTRKAAAELAARLRMRLAHARDGLARAGIIDAQRRTQLRDVEPAVLTYHSYAAGLLVEQAARGGIEPRSRLAGEAACWQLASHVVHTWQGPLEDLGMSPSTVTQTVLRLSSELGEHLTDAARVAAATRRLADRATTLPRDASRSSDPGTPYADVVRALGRQETRLALLPLVAAYEQAKRERNLIDYGDQVSLAARLAREHPDIAQLEREKYQVVLLDEYQDTSQAQDVLLRSLFAAGHPVTAVGDPVQAIYGWRGASAAAMNRFHRDYTGVDGAPPRTFHLSRSFRNGATILRLANAVSEGLRSDGPALTSAVGHSSAVQCALHTTVQEEATWIAEHAARLVASGVAPQEVAVLARKKSSLRRIHRALVAAGVPAEISVLSGLLDVPEVVDVVATLRVLSDPEANDAVIRLLAGARWRFGPRDLVALGRRARDLSRQSTARPASQPPADLGSALREAARVQSGSLLEAVLDPGPAARYSPAARSRMREFGREMDRLRTHVSDTLPDLIDRVIRTQGLDIEIAVRSAGPPHQARAQLDRLVSVASEYARSADYPSLAAFLGYLQTAEEREGGLAAATMTASRDAVQLGTVHSAKGLEWDAVFVAGLTRGVFPDEHGSTTWLTDLGQIPVDLRGDATDLPQWDGGQALDQKDLRDRLATHREAWRQHDRLEEHRLAYVALTRARRWLACSGAWWIDGAAKPRGPSEILELVGEQCRAHDTAAPLRPASPREAAGPPASLQLEGWAEEPEGENPLLADPDQAPWPVAPLGPHRDEAVKAAALVRACLAPDPVSLGRHAPGNEAAEDASEPLGEQWVDPWADDVDLVLAALAEARAEAARPLEVPLPDRLSVSDLVTLRQEPERFARSVRRPMPQPSSAAAGRGSALHAWLEQRLRSTGSLDIDDPRGFVDLAPIDDPALQDLQQAFEQSPWADRVPVAVEVPFDMRIANEAVRGRIDAVFRQPDGSYLVVDWKTGARPTGAAAAAAEVQLAVYRHAWAQIAGVELSDVHVAFHYVAENHTEEVDPTPLGDLAGLVDVASPSNPD